MTQKDYCNILEQPQPPTKLRSTSLAASTSATHGNSRGTTNGNQDRTSSSALRTKSSSTPTPRVPPRTYRSFDDRYNNEGDDQIDHKLHLNNQSVSKPQRIKHRSHSLDDITPSDTSSYFRGRRNNPPPPMKTDREVESNNTVSSSRRNESIAAYQSRSCSDVLSMNEHNTKICSSSSSSSLSWWNWMTSTSTRKAPATNTNTTASTTSTTNSRRSGRMPSLPTTHQHYHSSPELSFDLENDNDDEPSLYTTTRPWQAASRNTNINVDDDINRRVAQMLGTSAPHSLDYPAFVPPPAPHSSSSSSALRRRERRLRERYAHETNTSTSTSSRHRRYERNQQNTPSSPVLTQSRSNTYQPSIQCNPVSTTVLENLPLIQVRYEDLFPDEIDDHEVLMDLEGHLTSKEYDRDNCSSSSISIGINHLSYSCTICSDDIEMDSTAIRLPCSHLYHNNESCIRTWLMRFNTCPICRYTLPTNNDFLCTGSSGCYNTNLQKPATMQAIHQKHYQSKSNDMDQIRPIRYTRKEMEQFSYADLQQYYKSWVICTYNSNRNQKQLPLELSPSMCRNGDTANATVIDYLVAQNVIELIVTAPPSVTLPHPNDPMSSEESLPSVHHNLSTSSFHSEILRQMSVRDLKTLLPPDIITTTHIVEKQDLIDLIQQHQT